MKEIWKVSEETLELDNTLFGDIVDEIHFDSFKKAETEFNAIKDNWQRLGYEVEEENVFPIKNVLLKGKRCKRLITIRTIAVY